MQNTIYRKVSHRAASDVFCATGLQQWLLQQRVILHDEKIII
jgi:hypothetical protein